MKVSAVQSETTACTVWPMCVFIQHLAFQSRDFRHNWYFIQFLTAFHVQVISLPVKDALNYTMQTAVQQFSIEGELKIVHRLRNA